MTTGPRKRFTDWRTFVGVGLAIGLLVFSLRGISLDEVMGEIARANPILFLASIVLAVGPMLVRAWRWKALLEPVCPGTSFYSRFSTTMIGFMANNVLPARVGEVARAYALSRVEPITTIASVGSLVVERLLDGVVVIAFLFIAMALPNFPGIGASMGLGTGMNTILAILGIITLIVLTMVIFPKTIVRLVDSITGLLLPARFRRPIVEALETLLGGLSALRHPKLLARAGLWSIGVWLVNTYAFWLGFKAFGIELPFSAALFLQSLIALAVALPSAPGFFGLWEAAARLGLHEIWGVELSKALGFAIGFHIGSFLTVTIPGIYFTWRIGLSWGEMGKRTEGIEVTPIGGEGPEVSE